MSPILTENVRKYSARLFFYDTLQAVGYSVAALKSSTVMQSSTQRKAFELRLRAFVFSC
jgi:hypothetical protein